MNAEAGRFFRSYNRTIAIAYAMLLVGLAVFFVLQLREGLKQELVFIQGQLERHHQFLEFVVRSSVDQVESLRMAAGRTGPTDATPARSCGEGATAPWQGLRQRAGSFDRDALADRDGGSNVVGEGKLTGRPGAFYCDLASALSLDGHLAAMAFHLPHASRTRFLSVQHFHIVAPWRPARDIPFSQDVYADQVWKLGTPERNPERLKYWAPVFFGGRDVGLLAPVAAPVYDRDRFMGVVAIDMSLDYLHRVNNNFTYPLGQVAVVDASGQVLAHPGLYLDPLSVQVPAAFSQIFPDGAVPSFQALLGLAAGEVEERGDWWVIRKPFKAAPWQTVYAVPRSELWHKLWAERGTQLLAVLGALASIMLITYVITLREFVGPAAGLVNHLVAESRFKPLPMPRVPEAWKPWFHVITDAFRRSLELSSLRKELDIAARMQQSILPRHWPSDARFLLWGTTTAAREVGGDFYDHFQMADGSCALVVADVSGKGIAAGLFGMVCKTLLRSFATQRQAGPAHVSEHVNQGLCVDNDSSMFVTAFHAQYNPATARLVYANAGHPPPLLICADGSADWLDSTGGAAFGVVDDATYTERTLQLCPGDTVLIYTDGVTEAENGRGEQFGARRLKALFDRRPSAGSREAIDRVLHAVSEFVQGAEQADDITCVALHCHRDGELS